MHYTSPKSELVASEEVQEASQNPEVQKRTAGSEADRKTRAARRALAKYHANREAIAARRKELQLANVEGYRARMREGYRRRQAKKGRVVVPKPKTMSPEERAKRLKENTARWRNRHREELRLRWRESARLKKQENNPEHAKQKAAYDRMYRQREKAKRKAWGAAYAERHSNDPHFIMSRRFRARIRTALRKGYKKSEKSEVLLGCTIPELKTHIEKQFRDGMNWDRFMAGDIELDHIRPCASFDLSLESEQRLCFHWSNVQPLWWWENISKGAKLLDTPTSL